MTNPFEKAKENMENNAPAVEDVEVSQRPADYKKPEEPQEHSNKKRKVIDEDTIEDTNYLKSPGEVGEETPVYTFREFYTQEGRWIKIKDGKNKGEEFWSGLKVKNKQTKQDDYVDEHNIEFEEGTLNLKSWEQVAKMKTFLRFCKNNKHTSKGQTLQWVRMDKGLEAKGDRWLLKVPSLNIQISEDNAITNLEG